ncbi:hypothetical protein D3C75_336220 [compost metagenome]
MPSGKQDTGSRGNKRICRNQHFLPLYFEHSHYRFNRTCTRINRNGMSNSYIPGKTFLQLLYIPTLTQRSSRQTIINSLHNDTPLLLRKCNIECGYIHNTLCQLHDEPPLPVIDYSFPFKKAFRRLPDKLLHMFRMNMLGN